MLQKQLNTWVAHYSVQKQYNINKKREKTIKNWAQEPSLPAKGKYFKTTTKP